MPVFAINSKQLWLESTQADDVLSQLLLNMSG